MTKKPVQMGQFLSSQDKGLNRLISQARVLTQIKLIINQVIDYQIAEHIEVSKTHAGILTLICDSAVWSTRLRYMEPQILKKLQQFSMTKRLRKIEIKVRPSSTIKPEQQSPKPKRRVVLSQSAAKQMLDDSSAISDPKLQEAIKKLARNAKD